MLYFLLATLFAFDTLTEKNRYATFKILDVNFIRIPGQSRCAGMGSTSK